MPKKMNLEKIWRKKDCYGWAWHLKGRRYAYQNSNDLGLLGEDWDAIKEYCEPETVLRKIKVSKGKYIYIIKNTWGYTDEDLRTSATLTTIKSLIKDCHNEELSSHEEMLVKRYWNQF